MTHEVYFISFAMPFKNNCKSVEKKVSVYRVSYGVVECVGTVQETGITGK